ncbi:protein phosphatase 1 regulatory subunit 3C-B-like [Betta splendens]|uniref:Protein phosphatase 1 regulatory subunit n=1 Tax=Betta splendens TaxID=158456 RepID=A0A6P7LB72_BETSP|nr:protein phosphatase 1 regulatory subunit 3C-B-like [Betta splendens]
MNSTSVIQILNIRQGGLSPIIPIDMAMRICLATSPPLHPFLCSSSSSSSATLLQCHEPLRPCLSSGRNIAMATTPPTMSMNSKRSAADVIFGHSRILQKKKNVVFADSQGLALTVVHIFNQFEDEPLNELQFHLNEMEGATAGSHLGDGKDVGDSGSVLVLDFTSPASDYLNLRNRLKAQHVCLETCHVQEHLLSGTVQVHNISFEKLVSVRITFDSWHSFEDVKCQYLNNVYGGPDTDTFSFSILVPEIIELPNRVEFCIQYKTPDNTFWDNNDGNNYHLLVADPSGSLAQSPDASRQLDIQRVCGGEKGVEMDFDPFGSPRTSTGILSEWQTWRCIETSSPYW